MSTQTVNGVIIIEDDEDDAVESNYFFSKSISSRGSTKQDAISVENYDFDRHHYSHLRIKSEFRSDDIDLNQSSLYKNDGDVKIHSSQSSEPSSSRRPTFQCEICVDHKPLTESFRINGCTHSYCNECVSKHIAAKLQENLLTITCPFPGCSGSLDPYQCRQILPRQVFDRWGDALCEALVISSKKRFYCPYKECSALAFVEEAIIEAECPHCNRMVCVPCGTKWHPDISCEEYQKLEENERGRDDILLKKMAESNKWARCPSCKYYVERTRGCLYILCRCGLAFCYNCGTPFKGRSHFCYNCMH